MALLEQEAIRFPESLDDYEHVSVMDIGGWEPLGYRVVVRDHRFDTEYEIVSHSDYWDVVSALERSSLAFGCVLMRPEDQVQDPASKREIDSMPSRSQSPQGNRPRTERSWTAA